MNQIQLVTEEVTKGGRPLEGINGAAKVVLVDQSGAPYIPSGGGGGGGGAITIAEGADAVVGTRSDAPAADPTAANTAMSLYKAQTVAVTEFAKAIGPAAPGAAAGKAALAGGLYLPTRPTVTSGQQVALAVDSRGHQFARLVGTQWSMGDNVSPNNVVGLNAESDGTGGTRALGSAPMVYDAVNNVWHRARGDQSGTYVVPAAPKTSTGSVTAQAINGTSEATASLIAQIDNPNFRYKKAIIHVKNLSAIAFTDFVIKTKCNPADTAYDTTYTADGYSAPSGYIQELSRNPSTLTAAECRIVLDISLFSSIELRAAVLAAVPGTTALARWILVDV